MTDDRQERERLENLVVGAEERVLNPAYSKLVRKLRLILPLVAVAIVVMLFTWTLLDDTAQIAETPKGKGKDQTQNELLEARFESRDTSGRPYVITAARAVQGKPEQGQNEKTIYLDKPTGQMTLEEGRTLDLTALQGTYDQDNGALDLMGGVDLHTTDGYEMHTEKVLVSLNDSRAQSDTPINGKGPTGSVEAKGFSADNEKGLLVLKGPARLIIKPEAL
ncbi:MAG: LPS export ABC transporter periplasmic protein LptC [Alphaproteobacteria bacterium]|nr:LPS export ABC transporter periplasmic protein LptC [Alphaproteobacteria bacterium]